jgi:hypothetical protein
MNAIWRTDGPPKDRPFLAKARDQKLPESLEPFIVVAYWHPTEHRFAPVRAPGDEETATTLVVEEWAEIPGD